MVDEKKVISKLQARVDDFTKKYPDRAKSPEVETINEFIHLLEEEAERLEGDNDWIPVSDRVPDSERYILMSFENYSVPSIGRYEKDNEGGGAFYIGDEDEPLISHGIFVNAWMELPKMYKKD